MPAFTTSLGASILATLGATSMSTTLATATGVAATAAAAGGAMAGGAALINKPKELKPTSLLASPTPQSAEEAARIETEKLRKMRALAGGKTILTSEGIGTGMGKTLLGS